MRVKLPRTPKTINMYVNDAIGYRMKTEQVLYYSPNAFGTADTIKFSDGLLRIHDLKTGTSRASFKQLEVYAALFCLEYKKTPGDIRYELRIYKDDDRYVHVPELDDIVHIIDRIKYFDGRINELEEANQ